MSSLPQPLFDLWQRCTSMQTTNGAAEWTEQTYYLSLYGRGEEEALHFLYGKRPTAEGFSDWLAETASNVAHAETTGKVLMEDDHDFWNRNGYLIIKNAVNVEQCTAAQNAIWEFLDANPCQPDSWYQPHEGKKGLMLNFFQHPALVGNRRSQRIRAAYQELYGNTDIYLLIDKVSFNPPESDKFRFMGSRLHWDVSLHTPIPFVLQGLLYLTDTNADDGAFHCVPGFHNHVEEWLNSLPKGADPRQAALVDLKPVPVPGNAGDLVIWHQALPHCATPNKGSSPRMVQYIAYKPVAMQEAAIWI